MIRKTLRILCCLMIVTSTAIDGFSQKSSRFVSIVGCYSDLREISEGIVGNGVIKISKKNGRYTGTFAELSNELGTAYDEVPLENLIVNESERTIKFKVIYNRYKYSLKRGTATGKITKSEIRMNWNKGGGEYGSINSLMRRDKKCY